jgi:general secretion pathway protein B
MSTILDSLKKSSDKRDDSSNKSLDNFNFAGSHKSRGSHTLLVVLLLLLATAAIGYFGYQYLFNDDQQIQVDATQIAVSPEVSDEEALTKAVKTEVAIAKIQKPDNTDVKQRINAIKASRTSEEEKLKQLNKQLPVEKAAVIEQERNEPDKVELAKAEQSASPVGKKKEPLITLAMPNENDSKPVSNVRKQQYMYLFQLPFNIRKEIPKISLNIHVYDKDPDNRIAIINGVKLAVGDLIENEILLKEIIQDGIVLEYSGREFLIPK